jgi:hypothetical protein
MSTRSRFRRILISANGLSSASCTLNSRLNGADTNVGWEACQEVSVGMFGKPKILWGEEPRKTASCGIGNEAISREQEQTPERSNRTGKNSDCLRRLRLLRLARHLFRIARIAGGGNRDGHGVGTPEAEPLARLIVCSPYPREILCIDQADLGERFEDGALFLVDG